jgi:hypothetical protein
MFHDMFLNNEVTHTMLKRAKKILPSAGSTCKALGAERLKHNNVLFGDCNETV